MRVPKTLESLVEQGIIQEVIRPLMSGKEAQIYLVICRDQICAAKVYKEAQNRSFKNRADYMEGRKVRNTRDQRAMKKGSAYGRSKDEESWRTTEVDMIYRLHSAGVRVPVPHTFMDGVLIMELVKDADGSPAPRLGDLDYTPAEATEIYHHLLREVIRMLCAGVVHGDLSDFNVLLSADGPVVIDFPQSINAADNQNARTLLLRDVANLHRFVARFAPGTRRKPYAEEMWKLYESNQLTPETQLSGSFKQARHAVDTSAVLDLISDANDEEALRRRRSGAAPPRAQGDSSDAGATAGAPARRRIVEVTPKKPAGRSPRPAGGNGSGRSRTPGARPEAPRSRAGNRSPQGAVFQPEAKPKRKTRRGDSVQANTYVSPAARKDPFSLTPRADAAPPQASPSAKDGGEAPAKRRRRRRARGGKPAEAGSHPAQAAGGAEAKPAKQGDGSRQSSGEPKREPSGAPKDGGADPPRRRRRRRRSAA